MSETKQVPGQALLELFDEAAKSYAHITELASMAASWDGQRTIEELALSVLRAGEDVGGVLSDVRNIIRFYMTASTVAGKDYDARKARLLLRSAKGLVRLANTIKVSVPRTRDWSLSNEEIAKAFAKDVMSRGSPKAFYYSAHRLFRRLLERSREMLKEGSDNLVLVGILPRKRIIEEFEESVPDVGKLSEPVNDNESGEADQ